MLQLMQQTQVETFEQMQQRWEWHSCDFYQIILLMLDVLICIDFRQRYPAFPMCYASAMITPSLKNEWDPYNLCNDEHQPLELSVLFL